MQKYKLQFNYIFTAMSAVGIALSISIKDLRSLGLIFLLTVVNLLIIKKLFNKNQRSHSLFLRELSDIFQLLLQTALIVIAILVVAAYIVGLSKNIALFFGLAIITATLPTAMFITIYLIFNNFIKKLNVKNSLNSIDIGSVEYILGESSEFFNNKKLKFNEISEEIEQSSKSIKSAHIKLLLHDSLSNYHAKGLAFKLGLHKIIHAKDLAGKTDSQIFSLIHKGALLNNLSDSDKKRIVYILNNNKKYILACASTKQTKEIYREADIVLSSHDFNSLAKTIFSGRINQINFNIIFRSLIATSTAGVVCVIFSLTALSSYKIAPVLTPPLLILAGLMLVLPLRAMAFDKPEEAYLKTKPKDPEKQVFNVFSFIGLLGFGLMTAGLSFVAYLLYFQIIGVSAINLTDFNVPLYHQATTLAFLTFNLCTMLYIIFERADQHPKIYSDYLIDNSKLLIAFGFNIALILLVIYTPQLQFIFKTGPLGWMEWLTAFACSGLYILLRQIQRYTRKHSRKAIIELQKELTKPRKIV